MGSTGLGQPIPGIGKHWAIAGVEAAPTLEQIVDGPSQYSREPPRGSSLAPRSGADYTPETQE